MLQTHFKVAMFKRLRNKFRSIKMLFLVDLTSLVLVLRQIIIHLSIHSEIQTTINSKINKSSLNISNHKVVLVVLFLELSLQMMFSPRRIEGNS